MAEAPECIWIEDEFGDEFGEGDDDQWTYGTWDVRNYRGYDVEYVRADIVQALTAERDRLREALEETAQILSQCTFETIRVHGQYIDRREAVSRALAALKGETP